MNIFKFLGVLIFFSFVLSCQKSVNNEDDFTLEKNVFDDIFLPTIDSTLIDMRIYTGSQYSEKQRDSIKKDTLKRIVAFSPKTYKIQPIFSSEIPKNYSIISDSIINFQLKKFDSSKYIFIDDSQLSLKNELIEWQKKYRKFSGSMAFSNIYFDKSRQKGIFEVSYYCGSKCGVGFLVYVKKVNNKWKVEQIERASIS